MTDKIRIGIVGYGNLGKGAEQALSLCSDMTLAAIFTRRDPASITPKTAGVPVVLLSEINQFENKIDVLLLCGGSKDDLPQQTPALAKHFNTVDSFDTHANIPEYFTEVNQAAQQSGKVSLISIGWDPGLFSLNRMLGEAILPDGDTYTFWGKGLSQGHSDAVRRVPGVQAGVQYTVPSEKAIQRVRHGERPTLSTREKHKRECYVVLEKGADAKTIEQAIITMPNYFADYDTTVHFISQEELDKNHNKMPHGGFVIRSGTSANQHKLNMEFSLTLESNPEYTASVLVAYARAAHRLSQQGQKGAFTLLDVPPVLLSPKPAMQLYKELL